MSTVFFQFGEPSGLAAKREMQLDAVCELRVAQLYHLSAGCKLLGLKLENRQRAVCHAGARRSGV